MNQQPIGIFDSGMGGLTVLKQLQQQLPHEHFVYLGDTARLPYGTKSQETIIHYAHQNIATLLKYDIKTLVIACNTASAVALPSLREHFPQLPILGVIQPGAQAAISATRNQHIAILATETTIESQAYQDHILKTLPNAKLSTQACSLLVSLAEEGWANNTVAQATIAEYLKQIIDPIYDCIVLGCTHFPIFRETIQNQVNHEVRIVDSATSTALAAKQLLTEQTLHTASTQTGSVNFLVTDAPQRFMRVSQTFLDYPIQSQNITLIEHEYNTQPETRPCP